MWGILCLIIDNIIFIFDCRADTLGHCFLSKMSTYYWFSVSLFGNVKIILNISRVLISNAIFLNEGMITRYRLIVVADCSFYSSKVTQRNITHFQYHIGNFTLRNALTNSILYLPKMCFEIEGWVVVFFYSGKKFDDPLQYISNLRFFWSHPLLIFCTVIVKGRGVRHWPSRI